MTDAGRKVLAGFARLATADRDEVIQRMNEFLNAGQTGKKDLCAAFEKSAGVVMGPIGSGCPCCGR